MKGKPKGKLVYKVFLSKTAQKQLDNLSDSVSSSLLNTISSPAHNPRPFGYKKLKGRNGFRVRSGNYRIIYDIYDKELVVDVIAVGDRKNIYD